MLERKNCDTQYCSFQKGFVRLLSRQLAGRVCHFVCALCTMSAFSKYALAWLKWVDTYP